MIKRVNKIGCAVAVTALFMASQAQANLISNGSFETATGSGATVIDGWTIGGGGVDRVFDNIPTSGWQASDGSYSIDLNAFAAGNMATTFATAVGAPIVVTFDLSGNPDGNTPLLKTLDVLVDGVVASSFSYDRAAQGNTHANMKYVSESFSFTPTLAMTTLTFQSTTFNTGMTATASGPVIDNVTAAVPEPGVVLLMGSGLLGLVGWRFKKRREV